MSITVPWSFHGNLAAMRLRRAGADGGHRPSELREPLRIGVEHPEEVLAGLASFCGSPVRRPSVSDPQKP